MNNPFFIAGPCVIESFEHSLKIAKALKEVSDELSIKIIFKASFDKANRTSIFSYRGPGLEKGIEILKEIKNLTSMPITTDVHETYQVEKVAEVADIIQIPAFLCRQTDLLIQSAKSGRGVNVKKGQFLSPYDMKYVIEKLTQSGAKEIYLTERGTFFGYNNLVVDFRGIEIMRSFGFPVVYDATHSVQKPSIEGGKSGGEPQFIELLAKAAASLGVDGFFFEVHDFPEKALSDGPNSLKLEKFKTIAKKLCEIKKVAGN